MRFLLIANIFEKLAKQNGIVITKAMEDARKVEIYNQVGGIEKLPAALVNAQMAPADFDLYITSVLISDTLTAKLKAAGVADADTSAAIQQMVKNLAAKEPIKVNPQYGSWDYTNADLVAIDSAGTAVKIPTA
jgi:hypothetical protein